MNKKQEKEMAESLFWQQFPKGTEEFAFSLEEFILQAMYETGKETITLMELHNALGIAVGHLLQVTCQIYGYVCEKETKALLYDALNKSYDYYKKNPTWPDEELGRGKSTADNE